MAIDHLSTKLKSIEKDLAELQIQYTQQTTIDKYFPIM
jgi:hypothetical protein